MQFLKNFLDFVYFQNSKMKKKKKKKKKKYNGNIKETVGFVEGKLNKLRKKTTTLQWKLQGHSIEDSIQFKKIFV